MHEGRRLRERYGTWAVVTGASDGIGRACAAVLAAAGLNVVLVARRRDVLETVARELGSTHGVETRVVAADLSSPEGVQAVLESSEGLGVGLLVAAAGFGSSGWFLDSEVESELEMIDVNCRAVAQLTHHFGARFVAQGRGGIVLLSSIVAFQGVRKAANYAATKAWVQAFAEGLWLELAPLGVDVVASAPAPVVSGFGQRAQMNITRGLTPEVVAKGTLAALGRRGTVRPGWLSKVLEAALSILPRWGRVRMMAVVMNGLAKR